MMTALGWLLVLAGIGVLIVIGMALVQFLAVFAAVPIIAVGYVLRPVFAPIWRVAKPYCTPPIDRFIAWNKRETELQAARSRRIRRFFGDQSEL